MTLRNIERLFKVCENNLFFTSATLDYDRTLDALIALCKAVNEYDGETESMWSIGEWGHACLGDMIVGAHWFGNHYTNGKSSKEYLLSCVTGAIYSPNCEIENEHDVTYDALKTMHNDA